MRPCFPVKEIKPGATTVYLFRLSMVAIFHLSNMADGDFFANSVIMENGTYLKLKEIKVEFKKQFMSIEMVSE